MSSLCYLSIQCHVPSCEAEDYEKRQQAFSGLRPFCAVSERMKK